MQYISTLLLWFLFSISLINAFMSVNIKSREQNIYLMNKLNMVARSPHKRHRIDSFFDVDGSSTDVDTLLGKNIQNNDNNNDMNTISDQEVSPLVSKLGKSLETAPCLVLNADYTPLSFMPLSLWDWKDSLRAVFSEKAVVVSTYNLEIRSVSMKVRVPSVIALRRYHALPNNTPAMSRRNVYIRDNFKCQYCMNQFSAKDLTLDHVVPRSKGGRLTWTNTVAACSPCNYRKGQTSLEDLPRLNMRLKNMPQAPSYFELQHKAKNYKRATVHPDWDLYI